MLWATVQGGDFSNNAALCAIWMATVLSLQQALKSNALRWWLALGLAAGLSALTKYSIALLLAPLIAFTIVEPKARFIWRRKEPYLAAGIALLIFLPHLVWMKVTNFITIDYALDRQDISTGMIACFFQLASWPVRQRAPFPCC